MNNRKNSNTKRINVVGRRSEPIGELLTLIFAFKYKGTSELGQTVDKLELPIAPSPNDPDNRKGSTS